MADAQDAASLLAILQRSEQPDRPRAEASSRERELLQRIFDTVPLMMTIYEPDTNVLRVNRAFERLIGWSSEELSTISLMEQCYPDPAYRAEARDFMQACLPEWRDFRVRTRYGGEIESSWTNVRLSDETQLGIGVDMTDRNRAERDLRASEQELRDSHRMKDEFLATLSHELRNPLAPMHNAVELLRINPDLDARAKSAVVILERQVAVMARLVDDLLDLSRINSGKIELRKERVDVIAILHNAVESSRPLFVAREHQLILEVGGEPLFVEGDPVRLEQVFNNLLSNACKFTPRRGKVWVEAERQGTDARVCVRDSGVGMPPPMLHRVFEMFVQGDQRIEGRDRGLGIGLSLVKRLLEIHGGTVSASSRGIDEGSEFVVRLPLCAS